MTDATRTRTGIPHHRAATFALIGVTAVWGSTFPIMKDLIERVPVADFLAVRFAIAALVLAVPAAGRLRSLGRPGWVAGVSLGLLLAAGYALQTAGLQRTTVSSAGFITGLYVVFTPLLALAVFRTRVGGAVWVGVALAVVGLAMLTGVGAGDPVGDLLVLLGSAAYSVQIVLMERFELDSWVAVVERFRPARTSLPPAALRMILDASVEPHRLSSLKVVGIGGARLDEALRTEFEARYVELLRQ